MQASVFHAPLQRGKCISLLFFLAFLPALATASDAIIGCPPISCVSLPELTRDYCFVPPRQVAPASKDGAGGAIAFQEGFAEGWKITLGLLLFAIVTSVFIVKLGPEAGSDASKVLILAVGLLFLVVIVGAVVAGKLQAKGSKKKRKD